MPAGALESRSVGLVGTIVCGMGAHSLLKLSRRELPPFVSVDMVARNAVVLASSVAFGVAKMHPNPCASTVNDRRAVVVELAVVVLPAAGFFTVHAGSSLAPE